MNPELQTSLSLILFLPWFCIIGGLYCVYPRKPRNAARWIADLGVLALAAAASIAAMRWSFHAASGIGGPLWKHVLATLMTYGLFLAVIALALPLRAHWLGRGRTSV